MSNAVTRLVEEIDFILHGSDLGNTPQSLRPLLKLAADALEGNLPCPYFGLAYENVPGHIYGYGCPVCKAIGTYHLSVNKAAVTP